VVRIERRILSPTAINTYLSCPRKYYLRYIKRLRTKPSIHLIRGNVIHKTIQTFHRECARGPPSSETEIGESLLKTFNQLWQESKQDLDPLGLPQSEIDAFHDDSERMLLNFANWAARQETSPLVNDSEVRIFSDYLGLMGIIDAVRMDNGNVSLIDYKTSKNPMVTDEIMRQAVLYALLYRDRYNRTPNVVCIHFLKNPGDPINIHIDELFLEYAEILLESVREKTRSTNENDYPCTCGGYCQREFVK
jgi:putative RecB family exonuclease